MDNNIITPPMSVDKKNSHIKQLFDIYQNKTPVLNYKSVNQLL